MFVRSAYNYDMDAASLESGLECKDVSLAKQEFAEESDINTLVRRFGLTGELPQNVHVPMSGDFSAIVDFHGAMNIVRAGEEAFMEMPADVRARFANDAGKFLAFVYDEKNYDEAVKLGIVIPKPVPAPVEPVAVRVVAAPATPST